MSYVTSATTLHATAPRAVARRGAGAGRACRSVQFCFFLVKHQMLSRVVLRSMYMRSAHLTPRMRGRARARAADAMARGRDGGTETAEPDAEAACLTAKRKNEPTTNK